MMVAISQVRVRAVQSRRMSNILLHSAAKHALLAASVWHYGRYDTQCDGLHDKQSSCGTMMKSPQSAISNTSETLAQPDYLESALSMHVRFCLLLLSAAALTLQRDVMTVHLIPVSVKKTPLSCEPLLCNMAAERALQQLIRCV